MPNLITSARDSLVYWPGPRYKGSVCEIARTISFAILGNPSCEIRVTECYPWVSEDEASLIILKKGFNALTTSVESNKSNNQSSIKLILFNFH